MITVTITNEAGKTLESFDLYLLKVYPSEQGVKEVDLAKRIKEIVFDKLDADDAFGGTLNEAD